MLIIRDPLDIVASQVVVGEKQRAASEPCDFPREFIQSMAQKVNFTYLSLLEKRELFGNKIIIIKCENLVSDKLALARVSDFLQLPDLIDNSKLNNSDVTDFVHDKTRAIYSPLWDKNLTSSSIGKYKDILTPEEIKTVKKASKILRDMFGYT